MNSATAIKVCPLNFLRVWSGLATWGGTAACAFLAWQGIKFESPYSLIYLSTGVFLFPYLANMMFWGLPAYIPGAVLFEIIPGEDGFIKYKKNTIPIKDINEIDLARNILTLFNNIRITTTNGKTHYIKTYNVIGEITFVKNFDNYVFPYMNPLAKEVWNRKMENSQFLEDVRYVRKDHTS
ncbi:DUF5381 family protein [Metabacillus indicus]|uniref:DUF5381 family protein n=1 Tax=Metabacillus indicus TaxID=246786 RepID=UPI002A07BED8|nr:DUF5381 family protein [Metabacillus indicus]MDX8289282.1 DUF5381 family protein [Metabacillus indicus]